VILPDVNVLVYALRADAPHHRVARAWLGGVVAGDAKFALSTLTLSAVVRIVTNRRSYPFASSLDEAFGFSGDLLGQPHCQIIEPGERHWEIFRRLCIQSGTRGPDVTDTWYAALAIEWGCDFVTFERDFLKYPGLNCTLLAQPSD
jgi:toxin-antitoxin system PIN domain toxin